jgi:hypothetical protein
MEKKLLKTEQIVGLKIGRETIIKFVRKDPKHQNRRVFLFKCECGTEKEKIFMGKNYNRVLSCGCLGKERRAKARTKHNMWNTRFYKTFHGMKARCYNKNDVNYLRYGKRGIKIEWGSFEEFKKDMHKSYLAHVKKFGEKQTTIDRISANGNYSKENCRWATYSEQLKNRRPKTTIEHNGKRYSTRELADLTGYNIKTIWARIKKGWPYEKIIKTED